MLGDVGDVGTKDVGTKDVGTKDVGTKDVGTKDVGTKDVGGCWHEGLTRQSGTHILFTGRKLK
jgi:hypothetical protein